MCNDPVKQVSAGVLRCKLKLFRERSRNVSLFGLPSSAILIWTLAAWAQRPNCSSAFWFAHAKKPNKTERDQFHEVMLRDETLAFITTAIVANVAEVESGSTFRKTCLANGSSRRSHENDHVTLCNTYRWNVFRSGVRCMHFS